MSSTLMANKLGLALVVYLLALTSTSKPTTAVSGAGASGVVGDYLLTPGYYLETCPWAERIVQQTVEAALFVDPTLAAALLRLHFHDCFVQGCDASVLLDDADGIVSEKNARPNKNSLRGFEVVDAIKYALEEACPLTVSCADILAIAARDAVLLRGGPTWEPLLGRKDSLKSGGIEGPQQHIPSPNSTLQTLIANFYDHGLDVTDLVSLSGAHTIGRARCISFRQRLYHPKPYEVLAGAARGRGYTYLGALRSLCPEAGGDNNAAGLDVRTPRLFDNFYYSNLIRGEGLLTSDNSLVQYNADDEVLTDEVLAAVDLVWAYAEDQELFFSHFVGSIVKMGSIGAVADGEVRRNCRYTNAYFN